MALQSKFHLYGRDILFTQERLALYELKLEFQSVAQEQQDWFRNTFEEYLNTPDEFPQKSTDMLRNVVMGAAHWGASALTKRGYYDSTMWTLTETVYKRFESRMLSMQEVMETYFAEADQQAAHAAHQREMRKTFRRRAYGTYSSNVTKRMKAGMVNLTTGALHSAVNAAGNLSSELDAKDLKRQNMEAAFPTAERIVRDALNAVFHEVCLQLNLNDAGLSNAEDSRVHNLSRMPEQEAKSTALALLQKEPGDNRIYRFLLKQYKDPDGTLNQIAEQFQVDIDPMRRECLDSIYAELPTGNLDEVRKSIEKYRRALADYNLETDANLDKLLACEQQLYDAACTFHGTRYDSIEECEAAQKRFETEKGNIDALAPVIDSEIDKLVLKYTPESRDAAKEVHNALERRYAGLARTPKMLALKQFLFTYAQCEKDVEAANKSKATPLKRNIAAALCAAMIVLNVLNPFTAVVRWIVAIACGGFLWWQMDGLTDQKVGARARTVLDSGAVFHPRDTLVYTGTQNYSLTHEDKAPDAEIQKERRTEILEGLGAIVLIGAVCPLIAELL